MRLVMISDDDDFLAEWKQVLSESAPELLLTGWREPSARHAVAALLDGPPRGRLAAFPQVEIAFALTAGVDDMLADPTLPDIPLLRMTTPETAALMREYVCHHVIRIRRGFAEHAHAQAQGVWAPAPPAPPPADCSVGVLGLGALGRPTAAGLRDLGYTVSGWSRSGRRVRGIPSYTGSAGLEAVIQGSDILVCMLPLTPETDGLIDGGLISKLPPGAGLINVGRGRTVVEKHLLAALDAGLLSQAVLDVFEDEPLPIESRLWTHPRVIVSPHVAADPTTATGVRRVVQALHTLREGKPVEGQVNRTLGY